MSVPFRTAPFRTTGGTADRSLDQWFGDIINVREFAGVDPTGSADCAPAFQAAFDLAFGSSSAPHGENNKRLNRPVYIPAGNYRINTPLNLTRVVGGHIYGAGNGCTRLFYNGAEPPGTSLYSMIHINGAVGLYMERMELVMSAGGGIFTDTNCGVLNIDWDGNVGTSGGGTGGGGLRLNHFSSLNMGGGEFVVVVGHAGGLEGYNNMFVNCSISGGSPAAHCLGMDIRGPDSSVNFLAGAPTYCSEGGVRCPAGGGSFYGQGLANTGNSPDFIMESGKMMHISQMRTESLNVLRMENGIVMIQALQTSGRTAGFMVVNGGKLILEGSQLEDSSHTAKITGTGGQVYINSVFNGPDPPGSIMFDDYTGTVVFDPDGWHL